MTRRWAIVGICLVLGPVAVAGLAPAPARLAVGDRLPVLQGDLLSGKPGRFPELVSGHVAVLVLGFAYGAREQVEGWAAQVRQRFAGPQAPAVYEVPVMGGGARLARWMIDSGMRKATPRDFQPFVLTVYGGADAWKPRVGFGRSQDAYVIVIDGGGIVRWIGAGPVTPERLDQLEALFRTLSS